MNVAILCSKCTSKLRGFAGSPATEHRYISGPRHGKMSPKWSFLQLRQQIRRMPQYPLPMDLGQHLTQEKKGEIKNRTNSETATTNAWIGVALEASRIGTRQGDDIVDSATESNDRCKTQGRRLVHPSLELDILE